MYFFSSVFTKKREGKLPDIKHDINQQLENIEIHNDQMFCGLNSLKGHQGYVQTDVLSGNHKIKSAVLFRMLAQTIEAPKKRNRTIRVTNT